VNRRIALAVALPLVLLAAWAPVASATFHLVSIREVYPGSVAKPGSEYVELQMWAGGQDHVAGHQVTLYNAAGGAIANSAFPADVASGANQSTMVLASPEAEAEFGFSADAALATPDRLDPLGGAVCWESIDCVAWGSFKGDLANPVGSPASASGILDGMALRRTIAPGCPTLIEATDDRDDSATDFSAAFPAPRPNSVAPSERPCPSAGGGGTATGGPAAAANKNGAPQTSLRRKPPRRSSDRTPTFRFGSDESGAGFECRLDNRRFRPCRSPFTAKALTPGHHTFRVRARDESGLADPSPAIFGFAVVAKPAR
jgi:hypothetical protein